MRHYVIVILALCIAMGARAQKYSFTFEMEGCEDSVMYVAEHWRDALNKVDTARGRNGRYTFKGNRKWDRGMYALAHQDGKSVVADFCVDKSRTFTIVGDKKLTASTVKVKGCESNRRMFEYLAVEDAAKKEMDEIRERQKEASTKEQADKDEAALVERMTKYEEKMSRENGKDVFFALVTTCEQPDVPDEVEDKAVYYRRHYWEHFAQEIGADGKRDKEKMRMLMHSQQMFNKMNYFFYGLMYYADSDTICQEIDRMAEWIGEDTSLLRYVFDHIEPRYFRSTKIVGWDAVWCHLAREYYMKGRCPWISEGTMHNMRYNLGKISQSLIGAHGQELWMADTNQSPNPSDWISSHRLPEKYVILWFWDPDCHHCQEQSAELKILYDSMCSTGNKRFEVYAVGYESDVEKWKRYVREHEFHFVNVGGTNVNIDYQEAYNVHGAPTMIILNEKRDIIMNKVLPVKNIMSFLDNYERRKPNG